MSRVTMAEHAGFCYGVKRAVEMAEQAAASGKRCVMLGSLIHNDSVVRHLESMGLTSVSRPEEVPEGAAVLIRSHGEPRAVHEALRARGEILDATCPNVSRIHRIVAEAEQAGRQPVIIGTPNHPEITAIAGWCANPVVLENAEALEKWLEKEPENRGKPLTLVSQTTAARKSWDLCVEKAKKECTNLKVFDTICSATCKRQEAAQALAAQSDAMIVIGDRKSSNTRRLAELCAALQH